MMKILSGIVVSGRATESGTPQAHGTRVSIRDCASRRASSMRIRRRRASTVVKGMFPAEVAESLIQASRPPQLTGVRQS